jgi:hypothetical protein
VKKAINLVGRVFGRLTVLARAGSTDRAPPRPLWRCRCACGEETVVLAESLRAGRTRSCGCLRAEIARELSPRSPSLVGEVFGRLTVLTRAESMDRARRPSWRCRCACGKETIVLAHSLRTGLTRSCGCLRAEISRTLIAVASTQRRPRGPRSLVGDVFGRLTVLARAESTDRARRPSWRCRCACGQETVVQGHSLRGGRTRSCGCLRAELARASIAAVLARRQRGPRSAAAAVPSAISMSPPPAAAIAVATLLRRFQ